MKDEVTNEVKLIDRPRPWNCIHVGVAPNRGARWRNVPGVNKFPATRIDGLLRRDIDREAERSSR